MIAATYGGLLFSSEESTRTIESLQGWFSPPALRVNVDLIPRADGAFEPDVAYYSARVITIAGLLSADSAAGLLEQLDELASLPRDGDLEVTDDAGPRQLRVSLFGTPDSRVLSDVVASYAIQLLAADPLKYGPTISASTGLPTSSGGLVFPFVFPVDFGAGGDPGRVVLSNAGRQASWPQFTVSGGLAGGFSLSCVETGQEIRFEFPMAVSDVVTVDPRSGQAWINAESNQLSGYLTRSEWFAVPAGGSRTVQFNAIGAVSGTPMLTGMVAPAWL